MNRPLGMMEASAGQSTPLSTADPTMTRWRPLRPLAVIGAAAIMVLIVAFSDWIGSAPILLLVAPALAAWAVRRVSLLTSLFLVQMAANYGLPLVILRHERAPLVVIIVVLWTSGLALGVLVGRSDRPAAATRAWNAPQWPQFVLTGALIVVQASLILSGSMGYEAQLASGVSTPVGLLGLLTTVAPVVTLMLLVTALGAGKGVTGAAVLVAAHATVVALAGFRSAVGVFFIAVVAAAALTLPANSPWRRTSRLTVVCVLLIVIGVGGFILGAHIRHDAATEKGVSSQGSQLFGWGEALPIVSARLDLSKPLHRAVEMRDDAALERATSWSGQLQAFIPRALWPEKPIINHGQQVNAVLHGHRHGRSSSTITNVGDLLVNFGMPGVLIVSVLLGFGLCRAERIVRNGVGLPSLVLAATLSSFILLQERPLFLALAGMIRGAAVALALWWASDLLRRLLNRRGERQVAADTVPA